MKKYWVELPTEPQGQPIYKCMAINWMMIPNLYIEKNGWLEITISIHENKRVVFWDSRIGFGGLISGPNLREFSVHVSSETMPSVITSARGPRLRPLLAQSTIFFLRVAHQGSL